MRVSVNIGDVCLEVEYDESYTPEVAADPIARASREVLVMFLAIPDAKPDSD